MFRFRWATGWMMMGCLACGGATPAPESSESSSATPPSAVNAPAEPPVSASTVGKKSAPEPTQEQGLPTTCDRKVDDVCLPSRRFAKALCERDAPSVALAMFAKGTPWTRGYLLGRTRAWNASGAGSSNEMMSRDEEVLLIAHRKPNTGGMKISGVVASFDALRWDGSCVTLTAGQMSTQPPRRPKNARIVFKRLERDMRNQLKRAELIRPAYLAHRRSCKGVSMGRVSKACVKADGALSKALAEHVRKVGEVPEPQKIPGRD